MDECLDFWQSTFLPQIRTLFFNALLYKFKLGQEKPNPKLIEETAKIHMNDRKIFQSYFLGGKPFVGGESVSIADIMMVVTLEQATVAGQGLLIDEEAYVVVNRVKAELPDYDAIQQESWAIPDRLRQMNLL